MPNNEAQQYEENGTFFSQKKESKEKANAMEDNVDDDLESLLQLAKTEGSASRPTTVEPSGTSRRSTNLQSNFEEEIIQLKEEKFDNMEELAKRDGMCLVDIHIFDKLLAQEEENKELKLELKAAQEVSVVYMKRYDQKAKEERQIDEICSRIKCDDKFGHLIGKVPHH